MQGHIFSKDYVQFKNKIKKKNIIFFCVLFLKRQKDEGRGACSF